MKLTAKMLALAAIFVAPAPALAAIVVPISGKASASTIVNGPGASSAVAYDAHEVTWSSGVTAVNASVNASASDFDDSGVAVGSAAITVHLASPDAGTVAIDYQDLISVTDGPLPASSFGNTSLFVGLTYKFTPTVDSLLNVDYVIDDVISIVSPNIFIYKTQGLFINNGTLIGYDYSPFVGTAGSVVYDLMAGVTYQVLLAVNDVFYSDVTSLWTGSQRYSFSITERPSAPPPGSSAAPEPATWALMLAGFVGGGLRRRKRRMVNCDLAAPSSSRPGLATTVLIAALSAAAAAQASVVDAKIGTMSLDARATTLNETTLGHDIDEAFDDASFFVTPTDLSVSATAKSSSTHSTASLAVDARADWASSDHGVVTLNMLTSLDTDGDSVLDGAVSSGGLASFDLNSVGSFRGASFWQYNFTPEVDAVITFDVSKGVFGDAGLRGSGGFYILIDKDHVVFADDRDSDDLMNGDHLSYNLVAGRNYTFGIEPVVLGVLYKGPLGFRTLTSLNVVFDIAAAAVNPPPGGGGSAAPEPATWALMLAGFGLVGGAMRKARRPGVVISPELSFERRRSS